ncbi:MAG: sulfurtransferase complex subunit TusB [Methanomassiliicoccales archaeon]
MPSILFIMLKSPHENVNLDLVNKLGQDSKKGALLIEDAVYYAVNEKERKNLEERVDEVFVIKDDLAARGFRGKAGGRFKEIDYQEAVDLIMEKYERTITI